tara:strand:- start:100 stop:822 length:723 start_codon:yes stop_codon:yes gene_type:complete
VLFSKTIDLHFYTKHKFVYDFAKPKTGQSTAPEWFRKLPTGSRGLEDGVTSRSNLRSCPAFSDYHKKAIQLPLWSDLILQLAPKGDDSYSWEFSDGLSSIRTHPNTLLGNYRPDTEFKHLLIQGPWFVECDKPVDFIMCQPSWQNFEFPTMCTSQGVLNFYKQPTLNTQMYIKRTDETQDIFMKHGTPLLDLIPLTEKKIKVHVHFDKEKHEELASYTPQVKFTGGYNYTRAALKKCPHK